MPSTNALVIWMVERSLTHLPPEALGNTPTHGPKPSSLSEPGKSRTQPRRAHNDETMGCFPAQAPTPESGSPANEVRRRGRPPGGNGTTAARTGLSFPSHP